MMRLFWRYLVARVSRISWVEENRAGVDFADSLAVYPFFENRYEVLRDSEHALEIDRRFLDMSA